MTVNDAIKRVKDRSHRGDVNVTTDETTNQILRAMNDARREIVRHLPKQDLRVATSFTCSPGTGTYALASDANDLMYLRYTYNNADYFPKKVQSEREFYETVYSSQIANNKPRFYFYAGRDASGILSVTLFPTPDQAYVINYAYMKDPTGTDIGTGDLSSSIPSVRSVYHDTIWKGTLYHFLKNFDDPLQSVALKDYNDALEAMDDGENEDIDDDLQMRFDNGRFNYGDSQTSTGIKLI